MKKETWKTSLYAAIFFSSYNQWKFKQRYSGSFAFTFQTLFVSMKIRWVENVLITVAIKGSCCFILISGSIDEIEKFYSYSKRSRDRSE